MFDHLFGGNNSTCPCCGRGKGKKKAKKVKKHKTRVFGYGEQSRGGVADLDIHAIMWSRARPCSTSPEEVGRRLEKHKDEKRILS